MWEQSLEGLVTLIKVLVGDFEVADEFRASFKAWLVGLWGLHEDHSHVVKGSSVVDGADIESAEHYLDCPLVPHLQPLGVDLSSCEERGVVEVAGSVGAHVAAHQLHV